MSDQIKFYKGLEKDLPKENIVIGALYHCTDTKNTYRGTSKTTMTLWSSGAAKIQDSTNNGVVIGVGGNDASGQFSLAEGHETHATGEASHAEGYNTTAGGMYAHAEGYETQAGPYAHAEGCYTVASYISHAEGMGTRADYEASHAEGCNTIATDYCAHAEGYYSQALSAYTHAEGYNTNAMNLYAHAEGHETAANGMGSHAEGFWANASGDHSHAEGYNTSASGDSSHTEGYYTLAQGTSSHAEGYETIASGSYGSHAEGWQTVAEGSFSHTEGEYTQATGDASHAEGAYTQATNLYAHAEGQETNATGEAAHAEGCRTTASEAYAHAEGYGTSAVSFYAHAEGVYTLANNNSAHAEGESTQATGYASHSEGYYTAAQGDYSHAEGYYAIAEGNFSHAEGNNTQAKGQFSHAEGASSKALGDYSHAEGNSKTGKDGIYAHAEGYLSTASGGISHAEGVETISSGPAAHAEGTRSSATEAASHAEGASTNATGYASHSEGEETNASGSGAHAEGAYTQAIGDRSHAEGSGSSASGHASHAEGELTIAEGWASHAEGSSTNATGHQSHAEGTQTTASGEHSHAEGYLTNVDYNAIAAHAEGAGSQAIGHSSHAEGRSTQAKGEQSHAEGDFTIAKGQASHAEGVQTIAANVAGQHVQGKYNVEDSSKAFIIGGGSSSSSRKNIMTVDWSGNISSNNYKGKNTYDLGSYSEFGNGYLIKIGPAGQNLFITLEITGNGGQNLTTKEVCDPINSIFQLYDYTSGFARTKGITYGADIGDLKLQRCNGILYAHLPYINEGRTYNFKLITNSSDLTPTVTNHAALTTADGVTLNKSITPKNYRSKLDGIAAGAEVNVQSNWNEADTTSDAYINNKPAIKKGAGTNSIIEGSSDNQANANYSHAEGKGTFTSGESSHVEGLGTIANAQAQHVQGKYNKEDNTKAFIIGGGSSSSDRKNIMTVDWKGNISSNNYRGQNTYNLGSYYGVGATPQGYLFDLGLSSGSLMVTFKITGHSYIKDSQPFDTTFQFYAWDPKYQSNGTPFHTTSYSGVTLGADVGDFTAFYVNEGTDYHLYMYLNETGMYQTYNFELITNAALSNPVTVKRTNVLPEGVPAEDSPYRIKITPTRATAAALTTNAGSVSQPVYFKNGIPVECNAIPTAFNITANANDDGIVKLTGNGGANSVSYTANHAKKGPTSDYTSGNTTDSISGSGGSGTIKIPQISVDTYGHVTAAADEDVTITLPTLPTTLPNPQSLTIGSKTYDGSNAIQIEAKDLGLTGAMIYKGISTTPISDGGTETPTIGGTTIAVSDLKAGNVVLHGAQEFVWNGTKWELLGDEGSYKVKQTAVSSPTANGNATSFIDTISQDTNGVITVTKKTIPTMSAATASKAGTSGLVPAPGANKHNSFLRGDATWVTPATLTVKGNGTKLFEYNGATEKTLDIKPGTNVAVTSDTSGNITIAATNTAHAHTAGAGLSVDGSGGTTGTVTYSLATSGVTEGSYGPSDNVTGDDAETISVPYITVDTYGRVTNISNTTYTSKNTTYSEATTSVAGLMSANDKTKLEGIASGAEVNQNAFSSVTVGNITISADSKTDTLTLEAGSNVTITPSATNDKITIAATDTVYTHPTYSSKTSGLYKITVDGTGHVSAATPVEKSDITALGIPAQDTTYTLPKATSSVLGGVKIGSNISVSSAGIISLTKENVTTALGTTTATAKYLREDGTWVKPPNTTYSNATQSVAGLMSATDKQKLDGIKLSYGTQNPESAISNPTNGQIYFKII